MSSKTNAFNTYETTLNGGITDSATSLTVVANPGPLNDPAYLVLEPDDPVLREVILVSAISGTAFSSITRGLPGSVSGGQAHTSGAIIRSTPVHQMWDDVFSDIAALEADVATLQADVIEGPAIRAERTTSIQALTVNTFTTIIFNSVIDEIDPDSEISLNTGTGVLTLAEGWWFIEAGVYFQNGLAATELHGLQIRRGSVSITESSQIEPNDDTSNVYVQVSTILRSTGSANFDARALYSPMTGEDAGAQPQTHFTAFKIRSL